MSTVQRLDLYLSMTAQGSERSQNGIPLGTPEEHQHMASLTKTDRK